MNDLLMYIDQIDQCVNDSEIDVLESMIQSYDKSIKIIQESDENTDLSSFDIFQEGEKWNKFKEDTKAPVLGKKGESVAKRFLMLIPRLIQKLIVLIKKLFSKNKFFKSKMDKDVEKLKKEAKRVVPEELTPEQINAIKKMFENKPPKIDPVKKAEKDFEDTRNRVNDSMAKRHEEFYDVIQKSLNNIFDDYSATKQSLNDIGKMVDKVDEKNPGLIDELLEELGSTPRKKEKMGEKYFTIKNTKFFNFDESSEEYFRLPHNPFTLSFGVDIRIVRDILEEYAPGPNEIYKIGEFTRKLEEDLIPTIEDSVKTLNATYSFTGTVKVRYDDIVEAVEKMSDEINKILTEINKCIDDIGKIHPGIKKQIDQLNNDIENSRVLNLFTNSLINAVDHLITYRNTIQAIWDKHIELINKTIRFGDNSVEFHVKDTFAPSEQYANKYYK